MAIRRALVALVALVALPFVLAACGTATRGDEDAHRTATPTEGPGVTGELTVFAAASLTNAFEDLGAAFVRANPQASVTFNFAGSQRLAGQIIQGAPADVFASASPQQMDVVVDAGLVAGGPEVFATNLLEIAVEPGNPLGIQDLRDLADPQVTLVLAAPEVPAGQYAREALRRSGVQVEPASLEIDVRAALSRVALGEADAGIVYASDIVAAGDEVEGVPIPAGHNVPARFLIAPLSDIPAPGAAGAFAAFTRSEPGQRILADHGFSPPEVP